MCGASISSLYLVYNTSCTNLISLFSSHSFTSHLNVIVVNHFDGWEGGLTLYQNLQQQKSWKLPAIESWLTKLSNAENVSSETERVFVSLRLTRWWDQGKSVGMKTDKLLSSTQWNSVTHQWHRDEVFKWYRTDHWTHFISVERVYEKQFEIYWELCIVELLVKIIKTSVMSASKHFQISGQKCSLILSKWYRTDYWKHFIKADHFLHYFTVLLQGVGRMFEI